MLMVTAGGFGSKVKNLDALSDALDNFPTQMASSRGRPRLLQYIEKDSNLQTWHLNFMLFITTSYCECWGKEQQIMQARVRLIENIAWHCLQTNHTINSLPV
mmetsp:Transcript_14923/g.25494  ORF Transcript_14923/g.25494 Transcript_14923/m.25494 type:complete len:102 (+) Transcript_14923:339-644(+)